MLTAQPFVVPTLCGRTHGLLDRPPGGARCGALLVSGTHRDAAVDGLYAELALYLRSAGIAVLRVARSNPADAIAHAADVVAGVGLLRALGVERVAMVAVAETGQQSVDETASTAFAGFLEVVTAQASSPDDYARVIAELVTGIGEAVDHVAGVIHLVPDHATHRLAAGPRILGDHGERSIASESSAEGDILAPDEVTRSAARLVLPLPFAPSAPGRSQFVALLGELYARVSDLTSRDDLGDERDSAAARRAGTTQWAGTGRAAEREHAAREHGSHDDGAVRSAWRRLDLEWQAILTSMAARAPERVAETRMNARAGGAPVSRSQQYASAWRLLDGRARAEWVRACAQVFPLGGDSHPPRVASPSPSAIGR